MTYEITKSEKVFDEKKINVGDIITFNHYDFRLIGKPKFSHRRAAIVTKVEAYTVWIRTQDNYWIHGIEEFGLPIDRADEIEVIYRSFYNVEEGEPYGKIE